MKRRILFLLNLLIILLVASSYAKAENLYFSIVLGYDRGAIALSSLDLVETESSLDIAQNDGQYLARMLSFSGVVLYEKRFDLPLEYFNTPPREWFDEDGNQIVVPEGSENGERSLEISSVIIFVPYFRNAKVIEVLKEESVLLTIDLSAYARCNENGVCEGVETISACPSDCLCGNRVCDARENERICPGDCLVRISLLHRIWLWI